MNLSSLAPAKGSKHKAKRVGRGTGSGMGKTCSRGYNGQNSRSGGGVRPGFEGGQMPLSRRIPKRGFTNAMFKKEIVEVPLDALNQFDDGAEVTTQALIDAGIIKSAKDGVKILNNGELTKKLVVKVTVSKQAEEKIAALGGKVEVI